MMAVTVKAEGALSVSAPRLLFRADLSFYGTGRRNADLGPDGRFVIVLGSVSSSAGGSGSLGEVPGSIVMVQDWSTQLKRTLNSRP